jgi:hypothetical protein
MTDNDGPIIDWMNGMGYAELTAPVRQLIAQAREAGYQRGYADGEKHGAAEALRASTELTTALVSRPTQRALAVLERLLGLDRSDEHERSSVYWHRDAQRSRSAVEVEAP